MINIDNNYVIDDVVYRRTISDANFLIHKIGTDEIYAEAIDVPTATWEYEETDELIEIVEELSPTNLMGMQIDKI